MGAWGARVFDDDTANDWAHGLVGESDLSQVRAALDDLERVGASRLDTRTATRALAACEVIARLCGRPGYTNAYTEKVDVWAATTKLAPPPALVARAVAAVDRVLGDGSALRELWEDDDTWRDAVLDLRRRVTG